MASKVISSELLNKQGCLPRFVYKIPYRNASSRNTFVYHTSLPLKSLYYEHSGGLTPHASKLAYMDLLDLE